MASILVLAVGCGQSAGSSSQVECPAIGTPTGISLTIPPDAAAGLTVAKLDACWAGKCVTRKVGLQPATAPAQTSCAGDSCSARMTSTGGLHGFADVPGLTEQPVQVTVAFDDGKPHHVQVTPSYTRPGGPGCAAAGPQAELVVTPDHELLARQR